MADSLGLRFDGASFEMGGKTYAYERDGLAYARVHPEAKKEMILVLAGNSAVETVRLAGIDPESRVWEVTRAGKPVASGF
jgi:hypothetical protein